MLFLSDFMDISKLEPGDTSKLNVFIESIKDSRDYYRYDDVTGTFSLQRVLKQEFPGCYGFIPKTHHVDAKPLDVLVLTTGPLELGVVIKVRPIGVIRFKSEIPDDVLIAVPLTDRNYNNIKDVTKLSKDILKKLKEFLEEFKGLDIERVFDAQRAKNAVRRAIELYKKEFG